MNEEVTRALVVEASKPAFSRAFELGDDTIANVQMLVVSKGTSTIGVATSLQRSDNLAEWYDISGSATSTITIAPGIATKKSTGIISAYVRCKFVNSGPSSCVLRVHLTTSSVPST